MKNEAASPVSSFNGWDPLEEVIVGSPFHVDEPTDTTFNLFFLENLRKEPQLKTELLTARLERQRKREVRARRVSSARLRAELDTDAEAFVALLRREGIVVKRPNPLTKPIPIIGPDWETTLSHALMSRDLFLVVGNEIIETAPMLRSRYFESHLYKELFTDYFLQGARWTVAPRSRLQERNFDYSYAQHLGYSGPVPENPFLEIMFDGAQVMRLGRDLIFNCSTINHRMGRAWLQRHLGNDYRVHEVSITDHHIDSLLMPLRPGVLLTHVNADVDQLPKELQAWKRIIYYPAADATTRADSGELLLASESIGMNVLSLDMERVVVQDEQVQLMRDLEANGFTPIPCRWRYGRTVGGGFHCMTLDIRRRGTLQDYLNTGEAPESAYQV